MISKKQREMLAFIENYVGYNGYPPTYEEIRVGLKISTKSLVNYHLEALESAALLTRAPNTPRGIRLTGEGSPVRMPVLTEFEPEEVIELTYDLVPNEEKLYAYKVQQDSRMEALLNEGDILILHAQAEAENGELVAVRLIEQDEMTFRRYYRENGHVRLQPDNPLMEPLFVKPEAVEIQGKVVAVIRQVD